MKKLLVIALAAILLTSLTSCAFLMQMATMPQETVYHVGDKGPAGGTVIYDKGTRTNGWRYIEAAPEDLPETLTYGYARVGYWDKNELAGTSTSIGSGAANTTALVQKLGAEPFRTNSGNLTVKTYAAKEASLYVYGGYADWFIPSIDELTVLAKAKSVLNGLDTSAYYWSSTEHQNGTSAYYVDMKSGQSSYSSRENNLKVRLVRYF